MAGESPKKASYNLYKIIGKADNNYIVTSDKGVFIFTPAKKSETLNENKKTLLNGTIASSVLFATFNSGEMSVVYYDEDNSKYYRVTDSSNKSEEYTDFDGGKYKLVNSFYSIKDDKVAITFENGYYYYGSVDELRSDNIKKADGYDSNLIYISNGAFWGDNNKIYTQENSDGVSVEQKVYGYLAQDYYIYSDGSINGIEGKISSPTQSLTDIYTSSGVSYIIVNGSTDLYIVKDGKVTQKTCQGLESLTVIGIKNADENTVTVITSSGGTKNLNLVNGTIDDFN